MQLWAQSNGTFTGLPVQNPYTGTVSMPVATGFTITSPLSEAYVPWGGVVSTQVSFPSSLTVNSVTYYYNDGPVGSSTQPPFNLQFRPDTHGVSTLRAVGTLTGGGTVEAQTTIVVQ